MMILLMWSSTPLGDRNSTSKKLSSMNALPHVQHHTDYSTQYLALTDFEYVY